jgi:MFS family permease
VSSAEDAPSAAPTGYLALLRSNRSFRFLWFAEVVSFLGDWFNTIALYAAVAELSGSAQAITAVFVAKMLPMFVMMPVAGPLIDRFDRRKLMIVTDLGRALCALGLVLAYRERSLWLLMLLLVTMVCFSGIFTPTRSAVIPQITARAQLGAANALSAGTWSAMLAIGAAAGGVVTELVGIELSLVMDSVTFLLSAALLLPLPKLLPTSDDGDDVAAADRGFVAGLRYLRRHPMLTAIIALKPSMALSGGAVALLPVLAIRLFPEQRGAIWLGVLYASRGLGALVGSLLVRRVFGDAERTMERLIAVGMFVIVGGYFYLSTVTSIWGAALAYFVAAIGGSAIWVFSGTLGQLKSDNAYRGRVFAIEWGVLTLVWSAVAAVAGVLMDQLAWTVRQVVQASAALVLVPAFAWVALLLLRKK